MKTGAFGPFCTFLTVACALGGSGCATEPDITQDPRFGESVRHTMALQTADAARQGTGLDGERARATLRAYRAHVGEPREVQKMDIDFQVDPN